MEELSHSETKIFSVRIVSIDYYMSLPIPDIDISYSTFHGEKAKDVPVIRVYGSTPSGQKACVHIHGALPYLYVPVSDIQSHESFQGDAYKNAVCLSLEKALKLKGSTGSKRQHVHGCSVVLGRKLYGYYSSEELFLKIYFYYPHDVSRAANLLLGGHILERSLQPHESHIPFLLQFLADYNLFGMGHLHLVKMKFRPPVPDDFCSSRADMTGVNDVVVTADSQADSSNRSPSSLQVWKASNIPEGWSWQCSGGVSASLDASNSLVKRQSICELEGDTTVDDILNQQYKLSVSLSQTPSDVKMVQSLIPIWQEEYERSGIHEAEVLPDPAKPSPDTVLKTFSSGLDYENQLLEFCGKLDKALSPCAAKDEASSQCFKSSSMDHFQHRAEDGEAEALLKWLASSQAAEDINSDDELTRETILMPLLPSETVDKVIETANVGYENESQQECQDILDSVEDVMDFEGGKQKNYSVDGIDSQEKNIPQVDGVGDDDCWNSAAASSNEESTEPQHQHLQHTSTVSEGKQKGQHSLWALLPFSGVQICNMHHDKGPGGPKNNSLAASSNPSGSMAATGLLEQDSKILIGCSVRDLMRKKRCYQFDSKSASGEQEKDTCDMLEFKRNQSKEEVMLTLKSSDLKDVATVDKIKYFDSPNSCFEPRAIDARDISLVVTEFPVSSIIESSGQATTSEGRCYISSEKLDHGSNLYEHYKTSKNEGHAIVSESVNQFVEVSPDNNIYHEGDDHHFDAFLENKSEVPVDRENPKCFNTGQYDNSLTCKELQWEGASASSCLPVCGNGVTEMIHGVDLTNSVRSHCEFPVVPKDKGDAESLTSVLLGNLNGKEKIMPGCLTSVSGRSAIEEKVLNECISMTFHKKPPTVNCLNLTSENTILGYTLEVDRNNPLGQGGYLDDFPEFFRDDCQREIKDVNRRNVSRELAHDLAMGVPIHYQNDGSYSYLLTPAFSPPSVDFVCNWITVVNTETIPSSSNGIDFDCVFEVEEM